MRVLFIILMSLMICSSCSHNKVYQEYIDFNERYWLSNESARFRFEIKDTLATYNVFCNLRNTTTYPYSRIFVNFALSDTTGQEMQAKLISGYLFESKTGKPLGKTGLGDLYDHKFGVLTNYRFPSSGIYEIKFDQFMRTDTLSGILSVGLAIERSAP